MEYLAGDAAGSAQGGLLTPAGGPANWLWSIDDTIKNKFMPKGISRGCFMARNCGMGYADIANNVSNVGGSGMTAKQVIQSGAQKMAAFDPAANFVFVTEFSGWWFITYAGWNPAVFKAALRNVAVWVREVAPGLSVWTSVTASWWPSRGASAPNGNPNASMDFDDYIPIDDIAGIDVHLYGEGDSSDPAVLWNKQLNNEWGLQKWADYCLAHKKRIACSEWGMTHYKPPALGGSILGDSAWWLEQLFTFWAENDCAFCINYPHRANDGDHRWTDGAGHHFTPNAEAKMKELMYLFD